jgi:ketosteroid isomerase-like protein
LTHSDVTNETLAERLQALEDREAIRSLILEFRRLIDARDFESLAALFGEHGRLESVLGPPAVGAAAIQAQLKRALEITTNETRTYHQVTNTEIHVDGDRARAESIWCYLERGDSGQPVPGGAGRYLDEFERATGGWHFVSRTIHMDLPFVPLPAEGE